MNTINKPKEIDLSRFKNKPESTEAFYGLPKDIKFCKKCIISNQRPNSAVEYTHTEKSKKSTIFIHISFIFVIR